MDFLAWILNEELEAVIVGTKKQKAPQIQMNFGAFCYFEPLLSKIDSAIE